VYLIIFASKISVLQKFLSRLFDRRAVSTGRTESAVNPGGQATAANVEPKSRARNKQYCYRRARLWLVFIKAIGSLLLQLSNSTAATAHVL